MCVRDELVAIKSSPPTLFPLAQLSDFAASKVSVVQKTSKLSLSLSVGTQLEKGGRTLARNNKHHLAR